MASHEPATHAQHRHMHALWRTAAITDRGHRLALTSAAVGREVTTSADLTRAEAAGLIDYMTELDDGSALADKAGAYIAALPERATAS